LRDLTVVFGLLTEELLVVLLFLMEPELEFPVLEFPDRKVVLLLLVDVFFLLSSVERFRSWKLLPSRLLLVE
jgi:hypothetical protein